MDTKACEFMSEDTFVFIQPEMAEILLDPESYKLQKIVLLSSKLSCFEW